jgi:hypothetical protein
MRLTNRLGSYKTRQNRARAAGKPKIRCEVLGLPRALLTGATTSIEDIRRIRRQVSPMTNNGLGQSPDRAKGSAKLANPAPVSIGRPRG